MASAIVGALRVILGADTAEFDTAMKRTAADAKRWSSDLGAIGRQATALGSALTKTLTAPMLGLGVASAKAAIDFESSFANVAKTVDGVADKTGTLTAKGEALAGVFRQMAKEIPATTEELTAIAALGGQMGVSADNLGDFTRNVAALGVAVDGISAEEAAAGLAQIGNISGHGTTQVQQMASALVHLGNSSNATEGGILEFTKRMMGAGAAIGMNVPQVMALGTAMADVGINAEAGATAMNTVMSKMSVAVSTGGTSLKEFARVAGMSSAEFAESFRKSPIQAIDAFIKGLSRMKGEGVDLNVAMGDLGTEGIRVSAMLKSLAGAGDGVSKALATSNEGFAAGNKHLEEAEKKYGTTANQIKLLWSQIRDVGITLGNAMLPALRDMIGIAQSAVPIVEMLVKGFTAMPTGIQATALAAAGLVAAAGPALWMFGQLSTAMATMTGAFTAKGLATRGLTAAFGGAGGLTPVLTSLTPILTGLARVVTGPVGLALVGLDGSIRGLTGNTSSLFTVVGDIATVLGDVLTRALKSAWEFTSKWASTVADFVTGAAAKLGKFLYDWVPAIRAVADGFAWWAEKMGMVTRDGTSFWAKQAEHVRTTREVEGWVKKTSGALEEQSRKTRESAGATDLLAGANAVLAREYAAAEERSTQKSAALARETALTEEQARAEKKRVEDAIENVKRLNELEGKIAAENALFRTEAIKGIDDQQKAWRDYYNWLGERRMEADQQLLPLTSTMDYSKMFVGLTAAAKSVGPAMEKTFAGISDAVQNLGNTILSAVQGGGNVLQSIGSSLGKGIGEDMAENLGGFLRRNLGKTLGDAIGAVLPGVGALLGPALSKLGGAMKSLFGVGVNDAVKAANAEIDKSKASLIEMHGPLEAIEAKARAVGLSFEQNWGHQGQAGLGAFNALVKEFETRWAALNAELKTSQTELDGLIGKARTMGYEFDTAGQFTGVTFDAVKAKADEFGISLEGLGPKFRQQMIDQEAAKVINAFTLMDKAGGDVGGTLFGLKDEIEKIVGDSIKFGTTIPKNMEPWIKNLIDTGQLIDENCIAITDMSAIKFGEPVKTEFEKISSAINDLIASIQTLVDRIAGIADAAGSIPQVPAPWAGWGEPPTYDEGSRGDNGARDPGYAVGTMGRHGSWFRNFGGSFDTALHNVQAVVTPNQAPAFAMDVLSGMGGGAGAGPSNEAVVAALSRVERAIESMSGTIGFNLQQALILGGLAR